MVTITSVCKRFLIDDDAGEEAPLPPDSTKRCIYGDKQQLRQRRTSRCERYGERLHCHAKAQRHTTQEAQTQLYLASFGGGGHAENESGASGMAM